MKKNTQLLLTIIIIFMLSAASKSSFAQQGGYALKFDGMEDYAALNAQIANHSTSDFTFDAWVKTTRIK